MNELFLKIINMSISISAVLLPARACEKMRNHFLHALLD